MTISSLFDVETPIPFKNFEKVCEQFKQYINVKDSDVAPVKKYSSVFDVPTLVGIEIEVEGIKNSLVLPAFWIQEGDGSLRNSGKEFKTHPLMPEEAFKALAMLWTVIGKTAASADFSWRTSIHIHLNALSLETDEFKRLVLLNLLFEDLFFQLVGIEREQSPFCVPLTRSVLMQSLSQFFKQKSGVKQLYSVWASGGQQYKYSATNFARLGDIGTVEFRNLGGTKNLPLVCAWLTVILQLYRAAVELSTNELLTKIINLNSTKQYDAFVKEIFGVEIAKMLPSENYEEAMFSTVTKIKELFAEAPSFSGAEKGSAMREYGQLLSKKYGSSEVPKKVKKLVKIYPELNKVQVFTITGESVPLHPEDLSPEAFLAVSKGAWEIEFYPAHMLPHSQLLQFLDESKTATEMEMMKAKFEIKMAAAAKSNQI
jgi:hypothetical protein